MSSSEEKTDKKTIITRNKRICTLLVNESNYKKVLFFQTIYGKFDTKMASPFWYS